MNYILYFICIHAAASASTQPITIDMISSVSLNGPTFDTDTYGKDIMMLFWESTDKEDRMLKTSAWDMLATEKDKYVFTSNLTIADMDCGLSKNKEFCSKWIAFNISNIHFPYAALSYNNEPFKKYNGSFSYPALKDFISYYFERSCALNITWCTDEELKLLDEWEYMSLEQLMEEHLMMKKDTADIIKQFELESANLRDTYRKRHSEVNNIVEERDKISNLLHMVINRFGEMAIEEVANQYL